MKKILDLLLATHEFHDKKDISSIYKSYPQSYPQVINS